MDEDRENRRMVKKVMLQKEKEKTDKRSRTRLDKASEAGLSSQPDGTGRWEKRTWLGVNISGLERLGTSNEASAGLLMSGCRSDPMCGGKPEMILITVSPDSGVESDRLLRRSD